MAYQAAPLKISHGLLAAAEADISGAVPSSTQWVVPGIVIVNHGASPRAVTIKILDDSESTDNEHLLADELAIPAHATYFLPVHQVMDTGDKFRGFADVANEVTYRISGAAATVI